MASAQQSKEVRIVAIGHTGDGKSSTCSSIMMERSAFKSSVSASSETEKCTHKKKNILGTPLLLVDTPGLFDTKVDLLSTTNEVSRCLLLCAPGPHAFIYVVQIGTRFSKEYKDTLQTFRELFGAGCTEYMIALFTGLDNLEDDDSMETLQDYIRKAPPEIGRLVSDCGGRVVGFNNRCKKNSPENKEQVQNLLDEVQHVIKLNASKGPHYTTDMLKEAERAMKERERKLKQEYEKKKQEEIRLIKDQVKQAYERDMKEREANMNKQIKDMNKEYRMQLESAKGEAKQKLESQMREDEKRIRETQERHMEKMRAQMKEEMDEKLRKQEEEHNKKIEDLRGASRKEVQESTFLGRLKHGAGDVGEGVMNVASGIWTILKSPFSD